MNNTATVHSRAWYGDAELTLNFPTGWEVEMLGPKDAPALSNKQIEHAFAEPIGTPRIAELAKDKKSAAIVVDDLSRPTPAAEIIPFLLRELTSAGIPKSEVRFVVGGGSHRPLTDEEAAKKVGPNIFAEYEVTSHNFMSGDLRGYGSLKNGMPIYINSVVADADFKICLGGIYPHGSVGFGGGAKLIVPGVSGFATMFYFHSFSPSRGHAVIERKSSTPDHRDFAEEVANVIGLDVIANVVLNSRREICGLFVGDFVQAHRVGAHFALETYGTKIPMQSRKETDLVVLNCYPLDSDPIQTGKALWANAYFEKAHKMALNPASDGICYHGLFDQVDYVRFLEQRAERIPPELPEPKLGNIDQLHVWSEHFMVDDFYKKHSGALLFRDLEQLIQLFAEKLPKKAKVAVLPSAGIQVLAEEKQQRI
ncbi:MAG: lactate racemase domain-containing protein [Candidatus Poribacteria bacterium]|nr:lactate racemase domain-containing protein [Candidatus Poribacteria bacterium]